MNLFSVGFSAHEFFFLSFPMLESVGFSNPYPFTFPMTRPYLNIQQSNVILILILFLYYVIQIDNDDFCYRKSITTRFIPVNAIAMHGFTWNQLHLKTFPNIIQLKFNSNSVRSSMRDWQKTRPVSFLIARGRKEGSNCKDARESVNYSYQVNTSLPLRNQRNCQTSSSFLFKSQIFAKILIGPFRPLTQSLPHHTPTTYLPLSPSPLTHPCHWAFCSSLTSLVQLSRLRTVSQANKRVWMTLTDKWQMANKISDNWQKPQNLTDNWHL